MTLLTLDFETFFDNDYSLRKMTTEAYVRDPRFEVLCTGVKAMGDITLGYPKFFIGQDSKDLISRSGIICHHAHFDGLILSHHYGLRPAFWFDTLSMARCAFPHDKSHSLESLALKFGLPAKTVPYELFKGKRYDQIDTDLFSKLVNGCKDDTALTEQIFQKLLPLVPKEELQLIDMTVRMFTEPVLELDTPRVQNYLNNLQIRQESLLSTLGVTKKDLGSADKFAELLKQYGIDPPTKISPKTGKTTYAFAKTDTAWQELCQEHPNEDVSLLYEARLSAKSTLGETRAERLLGMAERGKLPVYLKYYGAHTGRWSGGDKVNFQNFPRGGELRKSLKAPEGYVICVADLAQIECRILNWWAREEWVLQAFRETRDLYCEMASDFYGREITKADKTERFLGKTLVLGCGFGVGWKKLQSTLKGSGILLTDADAKKAIYKYRDKHPHVVNLWATMDWVLDKMARGSGVPGKIFEYELGCVRFVDKKVYLPNGDIMDYTGLRVADNGQGLVLETGRKTTHMYGGKFVENIVQALARIVMAQSMLRLKNIYRIVLTTHDEIGYLVPKHEAEVGLDIGLKILTTVPPWAAGLPLNAEGGHAENYSK